MAMQGLGLALSALGSGLGQIPQAGADIALGMPDFESKVLGNLKEQNALKEYQTNAPLRALQNQAATTTLEAQYPHIRELIDADTANKLLGPAKTQAGIAKANAEAQDLLTKPLREGYQVVQGPNGEVRVVGKNPLLPGFGTSVSDPSMATTDLSRAHVEKLGQDVALARAQIENYTWQQRHGIALDENQKASLAELTRWHNMSAKLMADRTAAVREKEHLALNPADRLAASLVAGFHDDADREIEMVRSGQLGKNPIAGTDVNTQLKVYDYMRNKIVAGRIANYNRSAPESMKITSMPFTPDMAMEAFITAAVPEMNFIQKWWYGDSAKNAPEPTATHRYNPSTGTVEPIRSGGSDQDYNDFNPSGD